MLRPVAAIIGLGLIGGSLLRALRQNGGWRLRGTDLDEKTIAEAWRTGYLSEAAMTAEVAVRDADLVILCVPFNEMLSLAQQIKPFLKQGAVVTDVSSVRGGLTATMQAELAGKATFIGGHPMAGNEWNGWGASSADLFEDKAFVLESAAAVSKTAIALVERMVASIGAHPVWMTAVVHDRAAALISHAPHVVASAMVLAAAKDERGAEAKSLAAGCFRDMTRVAASGPEMWTDITCANRQEVIRALREISNRILSVASALEAGEEEAVQAFFAEAHAMKENFLTRDGENDAD